VAAIIKYDLAGMKISTFEMSAITNREYVGSRRDAGAPERKIIDSHE
jgi:hypothetical protein